VDEHVGGGKSSYTCEWKDCPYLEKNRKKYNSERSKMMYHVNTHTGNKPFVCGVCSQSFGNDGGLCTHLKLHPPWGISKINF
jgi:hypothetical protein